MRRRRLLRIRRWSRGSASTYGAGLVVAGLAVVGLAVAGLAVAGLAVVGLAVAAGLTGAGGMYSTRTLLINAMGRPAEVKVSTSSARTTDSRSPRMLTL